MSGKGQVRNQLHIGQVVLCAGGMALVLSAGLSFLGLVGKMDRVLENFLSPKGMSSQPNSLNHLALWCGSTLLAFLLPAVILNVDGIWRRVTLWCFTVALTLAWGPVLILAAYKPEIGVALIAVLWSGLCAIVYTLIHTLPVDKLHMKDHGES